MATSNALLDKAKTLKPPPPASTLPKHTPTYPYTPPVIAAEKNHAATKAVSSKQWPVASKFAQKSGYRFPRSSLIFPNGFLYLVMKSAIFFHH
jgi:hypothetical protein